MTDCLGSAGSLRLWQFPELEASPKPVSMPASTEANGASSTTTELARGVDTSGSAERNGAGHDERAVGEIVQEQIANGYAEGLQRGLAEGREKGYAAGIDAGSKAADQSLAAQTHRLAAIITRLGAPISALERPVEEAVTALALEVARCVIGSETSRSREYLVRLIREAIAKVPIEMGAPRVVLNPADLELIRKLAPEIENGSASLVGDGAVEAGGCLVVADGEGAPIKDMRWHPRAGEGMSQVDLSLASRWRSVMLALFEGEEK
jgi:flagellar assembly protein FliH